MKNNRFRSAVWLVYAFTVFEILFMISPLALYYYSVYGFGLNALAAWPFTAWLNGFFMPHYTESSVALFNRASGIGFAVITLGLVLFVMAAVPLYAAHFRRKGMVRSGLYARIRHPQYVAFAIMGFGALLVWPRFLVLMFYVAMLAVYDWLAEHEEAQCVAAFGADYEAYRKITGRFLPFPRRGPERHARGLWKRVLIFSLSLVVAVLVARGLQLISIYSVSVYAETPMLAVSVVRQEPSQIRDVIHSTHSSDTLRSILAASEGPVLAYVVPENWFLADLPLEPRTPGIEGHHQPHRKDPSEFKVLFTRAHLHGTMSDPLDLLTKTYRREPLIVVHVKKDSVTGLSYPPPHVLWGDIPTPLY